MKAIKILSLSMALVIPVFSADAASTTANALQTVVAAIQIVKVADLNFGSAPQGDPLKLVAPAAGADFTVSGAASTAYTISLPADATVIMQTAGGGLYKDIPVNSFVSTPAAGANGMLGAGGTQTLRVGATRAALDASQVLGAYTASFTVDVIY